MSHVHVTFPCGDIELEGIWHFPATTGQVPAVVVCHPHPLYGGSMSNDIVIAICEALASVSITALRFNFRGVGNSSGKYQGVDGGQKDVSAALSLASATEGIAKDKIGIAGYSFGARVSVPVAFEDDRVRLLALISPALSEPSWKKVKDFPRPLFLITGEDDFIAPPQLIQKYIPELTPLKQYEIVPGADHFWYGYEMQVAEKVAEFFSSGYNQL